MRSSLAVEKLNENFNETSMTSMLTLLLFYISMFFAESKLNVIYLDVTSCKYWLGLHNDIATVAAYVVTAEVGTLMCFSMKTIDSLLIALPYDWLLVY